MSSKMSPKKLFQSLIGFKINWNTPINAEDLEQYDVSIPNRV